MMKDIADATAVEYAVIAAMISVAAIGAFAALGQSSRANMTKVQAAYSDSV
jgi:Flp pilus assembly pilin Flp